ncbi:MAG: hypothetical protein A2418_01475 [Candidatus Brennerbacteria bacterium RIFOXYC1_FULL_41_11]|nr:MAG: hypothetical protein A2391_00250 [Candidatus Brennerbacteria bacterium RIFOXYB1_FULL_41_13]OGY39239.1 MAG: hypothetical protein A2418_01475 [Candidatus Brennerbacteria bacterium RIFOXYC1_FULL_41_11]
MSLPLKLFLAVLFGAVIGLERQGSNKENPSENINGIRTFSLISLLGGLAGAFYISDSIFLLVVSTVSALILIGAYYFAGSFILKKVGLTTEISMVFTFLLGFLAVSEIFPLQLILALWVVVLLVLSMKSKTGVLALGISHNELQTFISYAVIALVILPFLPNQGFFLQDIPGTSELLKSFGNDLDFMRSIEIINPRKLWFIVALITGIDVFGYALAKLIGRGKSFSLTSFVGGFVSSTSTTQALALRSKKVGAHLVLVSAAILANVASFFQIFILVAPMNKEWLAEITPILSMIILSGLGMFLFYSLKGRKENVNVGQEQTSRGENVFSIYSALKFAFILTTIKIITKICLAVFGQSGFLASSMIASFIGIDAIIINLSEMAGSVITFKEAALALILVNAVNLLTKFGYSFFAGDRKFSLRFLFSVLVIIVSSLIGFWLWP